MFTEEIEKTKKLVEDWHDHEGIGQAEKEMLAALAIGTHFTIVAIEADAGPAINLMKVAIESAFQIGRAVGRE